MSNIGNSTPQTNILLTCSDTSILYFLCPDIYDDLFTKKGCSTFYYYDEARKADMGGAEPI